MAGVVLEIDPTSEDSANVPLVLVDNSTYFLLAEDWPEPEVDLSTVSSISTEGELPVTARHHNTTGTFTLRVIGSTAAALQTSLNYIDKKLAKIMREGGTLKRTTPSGSTYVTDLIAGGAAFGFDKRYINANRCVVTVTVPRKPYWRGTAVTLSSHSETTLPALIFTEGGAGGSSYSTVVLADTPTQYLRLGEPSGTTAADASGNGRTGTYGAGLTLAQTGLLTGDSDTCPLWDASGTERVSTTYNPFSGTKTFEGWAKVTSLAGNRTLLSGDGANAPQFSQLTSGNFNWNPDRSSGTGTTGSWTTPSGTGAGSTYHWALVVVPGTSAELFVNGVSQGSQSVTRNYGAAPGNIMWGDLPAGETWLGKLDEVAVYSGALSSARLVVHYNTGAGLSAPIQGDVPALGRLIITEAQAQDQWWLTYGIRSRYYSSSADAKLFYEAETRTPQGGGAATAFIATASGGGNNTILANNLGTVYQSILSTQASGGGNHLAHIGDYQVYARTQTPAANSGTVTIALEWAQGDFLKVTRNSEVTATAHSGTLGTVWKLLNLGQVSLTKTAQGTQRWEGRIVAKSTVAGDDIYVDYLLFVPITEGSGIASALPVTVSPTTFSAHDEFDQAAGNLTGKVAPVGGTYVAMTGSDADDLTIDTTGHTAQRTATSDSGTIASSAFVGRAVGLDLNLTAMAAQIDWKASVDQTAVRGLLVRVVDASNFFAVTIHPNTAGTALLRLRRIVAGNNFALPTLTVSVPNFTTMQRLQVIIDAAGRYFIRMGIPDQSLTTVASGQDAQLTGGGGLITGDVYLYDENSTATACTRTYDNFAAWVPPADAVLFASRQAEIRNDRYIRQDSAGTVWADKTIQGDYLLIPPSGREGRTTEIAVKACRNDPVTMPDSAIDDISAQLVYTPRFLTLPE